MKVNNETSSGTPKLNTRNAQDLSSRYYYLVDMADTLEMRVIKPLPSETCLQAYTLWAS